MNEKQIDLTIGILKRKLINLQQFADNMSDVEDTTVIENRIIELVDLLKVVESWKTT